MVITLSNFFWHQKTFAKLQSTVIAHRGAFDRAPEETMSAFRIAVADKVDYIEMDLRETKDRQLILMHDSTLNRTTNGVGDVHRYTLAQLKRLDAGSKFSPNYTNERIITLNELINQFGTKTKYCIETRKVNQQLVMEKPLLDILNKKGLIKNNRIMIESFSASSLVKIHKMNPKIPLIQLVELKQPSQITEQHIHNWKKYAIGVGLDSRIVNKTSIDKLKRNHLKIYVYFLPSEKSEQQRVLKLGVDGVFTNYVHYTRSLF